MIIDKKTASKFGKWIQVFYNFEIRTLDTNKNPIKRFLWLAKIFGVDAKKFRAITIGNRVYIRDVQELTPSRLVQLLMHEARHRCQNIGRERRFNWQYISSKSKRAAYEGDCTNLDIDFRRWMWPSNHINLKYYTASLISSYNCGRKNGRIWEEKWSEHIKYLDKGGRNDAKLIWNWFLSGKKR